MKTITCLLLAACIILPISSTAQRDEATRLAWNRQVKPFRIIGNIYYVGAAEVASYLITTPQGHILLDSGLPETVPRIEAGIKKLGFRLKDVKILINSHAHFDHAGGFARLKKITDAKLIVSEADASLINDGGKSDFAWGGKQLFDPAPVDRTVRDNEVIELGGVAMTAHLTPGHTKGCTTWTMNVSMGNRNLAVVFLGSTTVPGYKLVNNAKYPQIAQDYKHTFALLKTLQCDVFLAPHGSFFALDEKRLRQQHGDQPNPFIDPKGYKKFVESTETAFFSQLAKESAASK